MIGSLIDLLVLLLILNVLVIAHELGHFVTARRAGVRVHEFGLGFPPRALVLFRRGETTYTLNWLPIGGFVRMEGEEVSPADGTETDEERETREEQESLPEEESLDPRSFVNQPLRTRLWILSAGIIVNFVLAWVIFTLVAFTAQPTWKVQLGSVSPDSPAERAGLVGGQIVDNVLVDVLDEDGQPTGEVTERPVYDRSGDIIIAIDGQTFPVFDDMSDAPLEGFRPAPIRYLAERPAQTVVLTIEHADGSVEDIEATLRTQEEIDAKLGALGFMPAAYPHGEQSNGIIESAVIGLQRTVETSTLILRIVTGIFLSLLSGSTDGLDGVAGPVGMVGVVGDVRTDLPPAFLLWFVGLISANLAVFNLLPIPPLDGSRMVMGIVQKASGDRISPATERAVYFAGWVALMLFMVVVTFNDIGRLLE